MVITSTIGNRVAVMSGTRVQIPPSPPTKILDKPRKNVVCEGFLFVLKHVIIALKCTEMHLYESPLGSKLGSK